MFHSSDFALLLLLLLLLRCWLLFCSKSRPNPFPVTSVVKEST